MITIIAGPINSGKTTKMLDIYQTTQQGDGFACVKVMENNKCVGYDMLRLSTNHAIAFMKETSACDNREYFDKQFKKFSYSSQACQEVFANIKQLIKDHVSPIYLDEIGALELLKKGHDQTLLYLLKNHCDIIMCVRDTLVRNIINHYRLKDYKILGVDKK